MVQRTEEIKRDIEDTRDEMSATIEEIGRRGSRLKSVYLLIASVIAGLLVLRRSLALMLKLTRRLRRSS